MKERCHVFEIFKSFYIFYHENIQDVIEKNQLFLKGHLK